MENSSCPFCQRPKKWVLFDSDNFYVTPAKGCFVEGYLLICPKKHFISMGKIPTKFFKELSDIKEKVGGILSKQYSSPIFFEHGCIDERKRAGCCVTHAHIHCVPSNIDVNPELHSNFNVKKIKNLQEIQNLVQENIPYLYYENQQKEKYVIGLDFPVPSQYFRQLVSKKMGLVDMWDWKIYPNMKNFNKTITILRGRF